MAVLPQRAHASISEGTRQKLIPTPSPQDRCYKRILSTPDVQLLVRPDWPCTCGSGMPRRLCCYAGAHRPSTHESVLWAQLHCCDCGNPYHPLTNTKVGWGGWAGAWAVRGVFGVS